MMIPGNKLFPISLSIILAAMVPQLGMNIITPALPRMGSFFGVSDSNLPLLITAYLAGYAIAVLGAGVIADRYNIKKFSYMLSVCLLFFLCCVVMPILLSCF